MHTIIEIGIIISSLIFWFYIDTKKLFKNERIINSGLIHSIIGGIGYNAALICCPLIMYDYPSIKNNISDIHLIVPFISFGYSFYDLYIGIRSKKLENVLHGFVMISCFTCIYINNITGMAAIAMTTETSSIFLNLRPLNKKWIDILFVITFFVYRLVLFPTIITIYLINPDNNARMFFLLESVLLTLLNVYWFYFIVKKVLRELDKNDLNKRELKNE